MEAARRQMVTRKPMERAMSLDYSRRVEAILRTRLYEANPRIHNEAIREIAELEHEYTDRRIAAMTRRALGESRSVA